MLTHKLQPASQIRPRRTQAERRRDTEGKVLAAAKAIVIDQGVGALTLAEVGVRAGYSRGIATHAFRNRQGLIHRLVEDIQGRFVVPSDGADTGDGLSRIVMWVDSYLAACESNSDDARAFAVLWAEAMTALDDVRAIFLERDTAFREWVQSQISDGIDDGSIRPDVDPAAMGLMIVGQVRGIVFQLLVTRDTTGLDRVREEVSTFLTHALAPTSQPHLV